VSAAAKPERFAVIGPQALIGLNPTPAGGREVDCCQCGARLARTIPTYLLGLSSRHGALIADGRMQWVSFANEIVVEFEPGLREAARSAAGRRVVRPTPRALARRGGRHQRGGIRRPHRIWVMRIGPRERVTRRMAPLDQLHEGSAGPAFDVADPLATMSAFDGAPFEIDCVGPACQTRQTVDWSRRERTPG
jgi:hypothetical protein